MVDWEDGSDFAVVLIGLKKFRGGDNRTWASREKGDLVVKETRSDETIALH